MNSSSCCERWAPCARAVLRIIVGLLFLQHGTQKLFGWPVASPMANLPPMLATAAWLELVGGALMVLGLFARPVAFVLCGEMATAFAMGHFLPHHLDKGPMPLQNGGELAVLYCFIFFYFIFAGAGSASLDKLICCRKCEDKGGEAGSSDPNKSKGGD